MAVAPLVGLNGWIAVRQPSPFGYYFTQEKIMLLTSVCYETSLAMQKAISYRAQEESAEVANALLDFSRDLATAEGTEVVLERIVEQTRRVMGAARVLVCLQDPLRHDLRVKALSGYEPAALKGFKDAVIPDKVARSLMAMKEPFVLEPHTLCRLTSEGELFDRETSAVVAPLQLEGGHGGLLVVGARGMKDFEPTQKKIRLLSGIADQAKLALNNATSFGNLELTFLSTVEALANALEAKDEYTSSHARWITDMSLEVGKGLGLDARTLKRVELGALFHDIGKIGIPHNILLKPGPLSAEEWDVMRSHPELGEKILAPIERLADVRPIIRHCHERFDGKGYPDGRAGHDIPIEARIIFVCDAFHAMTTDRPYRERMPVDEACRQLHEGSGTQFDPRVVDEFVALIDAGPSSPG
ncbi:MAG: HD domain-containing protein [Actinobacteria bacterium]|nr:HD domain-containing protein [Actinomycetota bacterium]